MLIIVQARMNSSRLPKKVLYQIKGKPLLKYLIARLSGTIERKLCIATSKHTEDDEIKNLCFRENVSFFRGPLKDVSKRMLNAANHFEADAFVRICGDSPLIDPKIVNRAISIYQSGDYDLVTNTFPRSFPVGQSVEVIRTGTFEKAYEKMSEPEHFEHVTTYYYEHPDEFRIRNFANERDLSNYRLVVDTPEDLKRIEEIIVSMTKPHTEYSLDDLIDLYPST